MYNRTKALLLERVNLLTEAEFKDSIDLKQKIIKLIDLAIDQRNSKKIFNLSLPKRNDRFYNFKQNHQEAYLDIDNHDLLDALFLSEFYKKEIFKTEINLNKDKDIISNLLSSVSEEDRNNIFKMIKSFSSESSDENISVSDLLQIFNKRRIDLEKILNKLKKSFLQDIPSEKDSVSGEQKYKDLFNTSEPKTDLDKKLQYLDPQKKREWEFLDHDDPENNEVIFRDKWISDNEYGSYSKFETNDPSYKEKIKQVKLLYLERKKQITDNISNIEHIIKTLHYIREQHLFDSKKDITTYVNSFDFSNSSAEKSFERTFLELGMIYLHAIEFFTYIDKIGIKVKGKTKESSEKEIKKQTELIDSVKSSRSMMEMLKEKSFENIFNMINRDDFNRNKFLNYLTLIEKNLDDQIYDERLNRLKETNIEKIKNFFRAFKVKKDDELKTQEEIRLEEVEQIFFSQNLQTQYSLVEQISNITSFFKERKEKVLFLIESFINRNSNNKNRKINFGQFQYRKYSYLSSPDYTEFLDEVLSKDKPFAEIFKFDSELSDYSVKNNLDVPFFRSAVLFMNLVTLYKEGKLSENNTDEAIKEQLIQKSSWVRDYTINVNIGRVNEPSVESGLKSLNTLKLLQDFILELEPGDKGNLEEKEELKKTIINHRKDFDRFLFKNLIELKKVIDDKNINIDTKNQYMFQYRKEQTRLRRLLRPIVWSYMLERYRDLNLIQTQKMFYGIILELETAIEEFELDTFDDNAVSDPTHIPAYNEFSRLFVDIDTESGKETVVGESKFLKYLFQKLDAYRVNHPEFYAHSSKHTVLDTDGKEYPSGHTSTKTEKEEKDSTPGISFYAAPLNDLELAELIQSILSIAEVVKVNVKTRVDKFSKRGKEKYDTSLVEDVDYRLKIKDSLLKSPDLLNRKMNPLLKLVKEHLSTSLEQLLKRKKVYKKPLNYSTIRHGTETTPYFDKLMEIFKTIKDVLNAFELSDGEIIDLLKQGISSDITYNTDLDKYKNQLLEMIARGNYDLILEFINSTLQLREVLSIEDESVDTEKDKRNLKKLKNRSIKRFSKITNPDEKEKDSRTKAEIEKESKYAETFINSINQLLETMVNTLYNIAEHSIADYKNQVIESGFDKKEYGDKKTIFNQEKLSNITLGVLDMLKQRYIAAGLSYTLNTRTAKHEPKEGKIKPEFTGYMTVGRSQFDSRTSALHPFYSEQTLQNELDKPLEAFSTSKDLPRRVAALDRGAASKYDKNAIEERKARAVQAQILSQYRLLYTIQQGYDNFENINQKMGNRINSDVQREFTKSLRKQHFLNSSFNNRELRTIFTKIHKELSAKIGSLGYNIDSPIWYTEEPELKYSALNIAEEHIKKQIQKELKQKYGEPVKSPDSTFRGMNLSAHQETGRTYSPKIDKQDAGYKVGGKKGTDNTIVEPYQYNTIKDIDELPQKIGGATSSKPFESLTEQLLEAKLAEFDKIFPHYLELKRIYGKDQTVYIDEKKGDLLEQLYDLSTEQKIGVFDKVISKIDSMISKMTFKPYQVSLEKDFRKEHSKELQELIENTKKIYNENSYIISSIQNIIENRSDKIIKSSLVDLYKQFDKKESLEILSKLFEKFSILDNNLSNELSTEYSVFFNSLKPIIDLNKHLKNTDPTGIVNKEFISDGDPSELPTSIDPASIEKLFNSYAEEKVEYIKHSRETLKKELQVFKEINKKLKYDIDQLEDNMEFFTKLSEDDNKINLTILNEYIEELRERILSSPEDSLDVLKDVQAKLPKEPVLNKILTEKIMYAYMQYIFARDFILQDAMNNYLQMTNDDEQIYLNGSNFIKLLNNEFKEIKNLPCLEFEIFLDTDEEKYLKIEKFLKSFYFKIAKFTEMDQSKFVSLGNEMINYMLGSSDLLFSEDIITAGIKSDSTTQSDISGANVLAGTTKQEQSIISKLQKQTYQKYGLINFRKSISNFIESEELEYSKRGDSSKPITARQLKEESKNISRIGLYCYRYIPLYNKKTNIEQEVQNLSKQLEERENQEEEINAKVSQKIKNPKQKDLLSGALLNKDELISKLEAQSKLLEKLKMLEDYIVSIYPEFIRGLNVIKRSMMLISDQDSPTKNEFSSFEELSNLLLSRPLKDAPAPKIASFIKKGISAIMSEKPFQEVSGNKLYKELVLDVINPLFKKLKGLADIQSDETGKPKVTDEYKPLRKKIEDGDTLYSIDKSAKENKERIIKDLDVIAKDDYEKGKDRVKYVVEEILKYLKLIKDKNSYGKLSRSIAISGAAAAKATEFSFKDKMKNLISAIEKIEFQDAPIKESKLNALLVLDNSVKKVLKLINSGPNDYVKRIDMDQIRESALLTFKLSTIPSYSYGKYKIFIGNENMKNNYVIEFKDDNEKTFENRKCIWIIPKSSITI